MYVLYHKKTRPTGRRIKAALSMPGRWRATVPGDSIAVRWGNAMFPEVPTKIQPAAAIARAGNKLVSFQCFKRDGVPCPDVSMRRPDDGTWFGRKAHGMCGRDIVVWADGQAIQGTQAGSEFFTQFIPNKREYRIHVYKGEILGVMGKYLDFPDQAGDGFIKNYEHGYRFRTPDKTLNTSRLDAAKAAVGSLGLDFGAVDLIVGEDNKEYVLEVNTAPALFPLTFAKYIDAIKADLAQ